MPLPLLIAIFLAFGINGEPGPSAILAPAMCSVRALVAIVTVAVSARLLGLALARRPDRRMAGVASRSLDWVAVAVYAWIVRGLEWPAVVRSGFGLGNAILVDELLILLPFLLIQAAGWWGLDPIEGGVGPGAGRRLGLKARQSLGLVLPVALVFTLGHDVAGWVVPSLLDDPYGQIGVTAATGLLVLAASPVFVRIAWPTRPLPAGPLRDRLARLARRHGFRYTDILIWDTGGTLVNAGVTGTLPAFRYVLLTDALIARLAPREVAAVFGHEIGHAAHRHLPFFAFFFLGSLGVLSLAYAAVERAMGPASTAWISVGPSGLPTDLRAGAALGCLGLYVLVVFGYLSRRFERQADVFGCRSVSCDRADCPPHADLDRPDAGPPGTSSMSPCPVGIRIFVDALARVAALNGTRRDARSWRHGSIARRIAFLEGLEGRPAAERRFQRSVHRLRVGLAVVLAAGILLAAATGSIDAIR